MGEVWGGLCPWGWGKGVGVGADPISPPGQEELEAYPLGSVQGCSAALDVCSYDSVLAITVQERSPPGTSVLLFQCERLGVSPRGGGRGDKGGGGEQHPRIAGGLMAVGLCQAEQLRSSLEKLLKQWKEDQKSHYGNR